MDGTELQGWIADFTGEALDWAVSSGLAVLVVLVGTFAAASLFRLAVRRLENTLVTRSERRPEEDSGEVRQRIGDDDRNSRVSQATLFVRGDEVEESWRLFTPLLEGGLGIHTYEAGTWGPEAADRLALRDGSDWAVH